MPQALTIVRRGAQNASPAAPPAAPAPLSIVKRGGRPVEPDFRVETVGEMPGEAPEWARSAWDFVVGSAETVPEAVMGLGELGKAAIPDALNQAFGGAAGATGPWAFVKGQLGAHGKTLERARDAYASGDYGNAMLHFTNWLVPMLGPAVDEAQYGEVPTGGVAEAIGARDSQARRMGRATGVLGQLLAPRAVANVVGGRRVPGLGLKNPALSAEDLAYAQREGIPVDAATATGSKAVRNLQAVADNSLSEAVTHRGQTFRAAQNEAIARAGDKLASDVRPADWTPERAGAHLRRQLEKNVGESRATASDAYAKLREIEESNTYYRIHETQPEVSRTTSDGRSAVLQPRQTTNVSLPVDLAEAKAGIRPLYDELLGKKERVGLPGDETRVLQALDKVMQSENVQPLSQADSILSELKRLGRGDGPPTRARAAAQKATRELEKRVAAMTERAPKEVKAALDEGRAATRAKYEALDVLDSLRDEPVQTFRNLMAPGDASLKKLRAVAKFLPPEDMATLGRAWLQSELEAVAGQKNGWARMRQRWNQVGAETRKIVLGKSPTLARDLDHLLRVAAEIEKNPNPSGTALTLWSSGQGALLFTDPVTGAASLVGTGLLSKLLYSPAGVRLLTRGLTTPRGSRLAAAAVGADLAALSERLGAPMTPAPAGAEDRRR